MCLDIPAGAADLRRLRGAEFDDARGVPKIPPLLRQTGEDGETDKKGGGNCMCQHIKGSFLHSFPKPMSLAFVCFVTGRMELIVIMSQVPSPLLMVDNGDCRGVL